MNSFRHLLFSASALSLLTLTRHGIVLDWSKLPEGQSWTSGDTKGSFDPDPANAGDDIAISVASHGVNFTNEYPQNAQFDPKMQIGNDDAFSLRLRTPGMESEKNSVTITITFNYPQGVNNVSFSLLDVDASDADTGGRWIDRISSISATPVEGPADSVALIGENISTDVNTLLDSGTLKMTVAGNPKAGDVTDHSGDVFFHTDETLIRSITFTWNNPGKNFDGQAIALGNISFTPVPEIGGSRGSLIVCGGLLVGWRKRNRRQPDLDSVYRKSRVKGQRPGHRMREDFRYTL